MRYVAATGVSGCDSDAARTRLTLLKLSTCVENRARENLTEDVGVVAAAVDSFHWRTCRIH